ncbi:MAG: MATE family efflux transporter [Acidobacteria bacterium]|nr:MATE family efflux transporter [Acidobacteriota bacterium]
MAPPARTPPADVVSSLRRRLAVVRGEARPLLRLAGPVVLAELGWMAMGLVDTIMVGPLGPAAIGAVGLGASLFMAVAIFGMGLLLGLDTLVSQAFGAGRLDECRRWLAHGLVVGLVVGLPLSALVWAGTFLLGQGGFHPEVERLTVPYVRIVTVSLLPLMAYAAFRRYLQGMGLVRPISIALVTANLVNVAANWVLIYGRLGLPALGTDGAAWATVISRLYMALVLGVTVVMVNRERGSAPAAGDWTVTAAGVRRLVGLGLPAALQVTLEVGVFAAATALAGRLAPVALASHQIALNVASFVFMVPLGVASAGAVLVGHAIGRRDRPGAGRAGWTALVLIAGFMMGVAAVFVTVPHWLLMVFTRDSGVIAVGTRLLFVAAIFQLFDGLQAVATGVLRGVGETRTPMLWNLAGHWGFGLPVGYSLCFVAGWGVIGLWIGLSVGLILVGSVLVLVWAKHVRRLNHD